MPTEAPVVLFVYKRPDHTRRTLESLARCEGAAVTDLWIFSDGPRSEGDAASVAQVRVVVRGARGFRSVKVIEAARNQGLAKSVIGGVGEVLASSHSCIVVEDDLELAPGFLVFLNRALDAYQDDPRVFTLSGYTPPWNRVPAEPPGSVWFAPRTCSWGWAVWKDRWDQVDWAVSDRSVFERDRKARKAFNRGGRDLSYFLKRQFDGTIDSWAVRMAWSQSRRGGLTLYPTRSFVDNRGLDGSGTHSQAQMNQGNDLSLALVPQVWPRPTEPPRGLLRQFRRHYEGSGTQRWLARWKKLWRWRP